MSLPNDKPIVYLTANDLYSLNSEVVGDLPFVRDRFLLQSAIHRPKISLFGEPQFPTLWDKAAVLLESVAYHHLFADGNKRTAVRAVTMFLNLNGWQPMWDTEESYQFILSVAKGERDITQIAEWLAEHSRPLR